jgi:3-hydroxyacyl-[acyl-carrier-protein] dehydratase
MLLDNFFSIESLDVAEGAIHSRVRIQADHQIFNGHFPGQPIVPGVCMIEMIKEIVEKCEQRTFLLQGASNIKFLSIIDPRQNNLINATVAIEARETNTLKINASLFAGEVTFFKLKAILKSA